MNEQALKSKLKLIAKEQKLTFNQIWKYLILERFLSRLAISSFSDKLVFKGGLLLSYYIELGRETMDVDLLLTKINFAISNVSKILEEICSTKCNDYFRFELEKLEPTDHMHMFYHGFEATINVQYGNMKDKIHLDIAVGDKAIPQLGKIELLYYKDTPLFENIISLYVYPVETIFAEKLETAVRKGATNSRMKDFHDLLLLKDSSIMNYAVLKNNILATFKHRNTDLLLPIKFDDNDLSDMNTLWIKHFEGLKDDIIQSKLPNNFKDVINNINFWLESLNLEQANN